MKKGNWKKVFAWVVVFAFVLSTFPVPSSAAAEIADSVYINGNIYTMDSVIWQGVPISFSVMPVIRDGKLYVEAAALADKLGATVAYKEGSLELTMSKGDKALKLTVAKVGDQELVPIRDVLEGFEYSLIWNNLSKSVSIA